MRARIYILYIHIYIHTYIHTLTCACTHIYTLYIYTLIAIYNVTQKSFVRNVQSVSKWRNVFHVLLIYGMYGKMVTIEGGGEVE